MASLTSTQIRNRLSKCANSAHKEMGLRAVNSAIIYQTKDPLQAELELARAKFALGAALEITRLQSKK